jgi:N-glycosylase/DNA lyase
VSLDELISKYNSKKEDLKKRLEEFKAVGKQDDARIFAELAFCLCTPQSRAITCWKAVESLTKNNLLYTGSNIQIKPFLNAVRFNENKSNYIVQAREMFSNNGSISMKDKLFSIGEPEKIRDWLYDNVNGMGMKEASHFLRNIGFGESLAILDSHILKNLVKYGVISEIPKSLTKKKYLEIEQKMKEFSQKSGIPFDELDLLFWSEETGMIFK